WWRRNSLVAQVSREEKHLVRTRPHEALRDVGSGRHEWRDAGLGFPDDARGIVLLDDGDSIVDFRIAAVEVTLRESGEDRIADNRGIETDDREAEHGNLRPALVIVGHLEQRDRRHEGGVVAERDRQRGFAMTLRIGHANPRPVAGGADRYTDE